MTDSAENAKAWTPDPSIIRRSGEPPVLTEDEVRDIERISAEHGQVTRLRMAVIDSWNALEDELSRLLGVAACMPDPVAAAILYFSPHSFSTRLQILDRLIEHLIISGAKDATILQDWKKLSGRLKTPKSTRDLAAHGSITTYNDGKNHVRLSPTLGHMHTNLKSYRDGKLPGVGVTELGQSVDAINTRTAAVSAFRAHLLLA